MDGSVTDIHNLHKRQGWSGIGYHFYIRKDGSVWQGRPLNCLGAHCKNHNSHTIGVCLEGNFEKENPTSSQLSSLAALLPQIQSQFSNTLSIEPHSALYNTACPGRNLTPYFTSTSVERFIQNISPSSITPITSVNDILWELNNRKVISNTELWKTKTANDQDVYWLCRKAANALRGTPEF